MKKEIIVMKSDWLATIDKFQVGEEYKFTVNPKVAISIRQTASRVERSK